MANPKYEEWLTPEGLTLLEGWARDGLTNEQIASNMGVAESTLYKWKNEQVEISEALKRGKEVADYQVENALFKRALGFRYVEVTREHGEIVKEVTKEVAPDTTAAIFWLKNRKPSEWRDKQEISHTGKMDHRLDVTGLTTEELRRLAQLDD